MPFIVRKTYIQRKPPKTILTMNFKSYDEKKFIEHLHKLPWSVIDDPKDQLQIFVSLFNDASEMHAHLREKRVRANYVPWKTTTINDLMEQRERIKLLAQKKRCKDLYNEYKKICNNVNSAIRKSKAEYYKT